MRTSRAATCGLIFVALGVAPWLASDPASPAFLQARAAPRADTLLAGATFDTAWTRIRDAYYDPGMRGVDWEGVRAELRPRAIAADDAGELRAVLTEMLQRLGESHFGIIPGAAAGAFQDAAPTGEGDPGLDVRWADGDLLVTAVRPDSPAARAGILPGWIVDEVAGVPTDSLAAWTALAALPGEEGRHLALWMPLNSRQRLLGPEGSAVALRLRDGSGTLRAFEVPRAPPTGEPVTFGNLPVMRMETSHRIVERPGGTRIGVLRLSVWFPAAVPAVGRAIQEFRELDGIVFDLRGNPGGLGALVMGIGGHFLDEPLSLGEMRTRDATLRFVVNPQRVGPDGRRVEPFAGPLAILVDPLTASTSEIFAGGMQALGRARIFGEPTAGQALPALVTSLPNGDRLIHAVADFTAPDGSRLEGVGVRPDVFASPSRAELLDGGDPTLDRAIAWLESIAEGTEAPGSGPQ